MAHWLRLTVHGGAWMPFVVIVWYALTNQLGAEPIREIILRTGKTALVLLILSLACTPVNMLLGFNAVIKARRTLGLYAFFYALAHLLTFVVVDYGLDLGLLSEAIFEKPYALVGLTSFLILLPLAITSTKGWQKRLGKLWKRLHRWVYIAALLAIIHFVWLVKLDVREPLTYGAIVVLLLALRVRHLRERLGQFRARWHTTLAQRRTRLPP
jgi:sulfoxide reductase heme-binding subunit YedZ